MTQETEPAQRLIREAHVARNIVASLASQRPSFQVAGLGFVDREGGGEVCALDLTEGARRYRVFVVEVLA